MVKILHATDVHTDLKKYEAIVNHANSSDVDAVLITGDLTDKDSEAYQVVFASASASATKQYGGGKLQDEFKKVSSLIQKAREMHSAGASEEDLEGLVGQVQQSQKDLKQISSEDPNSSKIGEEALKAFRAYQVSEAKAVDGVLGRSNKPVYALTGNHDPLFVSDIMEHVHFLDRDGSAVVKDIRFAGTPSTYEMVPGIPREDYSHLADYFLDPAQVGKSHEFNRLKNEEIDVLATHCGLADRVERDTYKHKKPDQVMYTLLRDKKIKLNLSGHFHEPLNKQVNGVLQLNPGSEQVYETVLEKKKDGVYVAKLVVHGY